MKKLILALVAAIGLSGCVVHTGPGVYSEGCTTFCDDLGCREVCGSYYYTTEGHVVYWDTHLGCWVGPHGYWQQGVFYRGHHPVYHYWYHGGGGYNRGGGYHGGHRR